MAWDAYKEAEKGNWTGFTIYDAFDVLSRATPNSLNPYNIIQLDCTYSMYDSDFTGFMNGPIREKLGIIPDDKQWDESWERNDLIDHDEPVLNLVDEVLK